MANGFMTIEEVAKFLRVSYNTIYRAIQNGKLKTLRAGRQHRIRQEDLEEYLGRKD